MIHNGRADGCFGLVAKVKSQIHILLQPRLELLSLIYRRFKCALQQQGVVGHLDTRQMTCLRALALVVYAVEHVEAVPNRRRDTVLRSQEGRHRILEVPVRTLIRASKTQVSALIVL